MDNLNDLKAVWLTAKTNSLPDSAEMLRIIKKYRNETLAKKAGLVVAALLLVGLMILVVCMYRPAMLTTRIGEGCIITAGLILIATNSNSLARFYKLKDCSNKDFLKFLQQTRLRQLFYHKRTQVVAMAFDAAGLLFYLFEFVHNNIILSITAYTLTGAFFAALWFIIRPRVFSRQSKKLTDRIERIESISKQLQK